LQVLTPDGKETNLLDSLEKTTRKAGKKEVVVYRLKYTPQMRGDHIFLLPTPRIWMEEEGEFLQDVALNCRPAKYPHKKPSLGQLQLGSDRLSGPAPAVRAGGSAPGAH
jgi:hypothetical protein